MIIRLPIAMSSDFGLFSWDGAEEKLYNAGSVFDAVWFRFA